MIDKELGCAIGGVTTSYNPPPIRGYDYWLIVIAVVVAVLFLIS
jgi:hypothetical protein